MTPEGETIPMAKKLDFKVTNNMAEYKACIYGVEAALATRAKDLLVYGDSMLVISQANKEWEVKEEKLKPYNGYLKTLIRGFAKCLLIHLSRDENQMADTLATLSSMWDKPTGIAMKPLVIMKTKAPCYGGKSVMGTQIGPEEKPWIYNIQKFIEERKYPNEANSKKKYALCVLARNYASHDGILYKRMLNGTQLRCLKKDKVDEVMREIHAGVCGPHMNGIILAKKIVRQGYYWMSMEKDCIQIVR